jgi:hypothetical protein
MTNEQWVELRVHGVSGTPPEELLARPHVLQVDGDDRSRFFHAVDAAGHVLAAEDGHAVEGFHWGRYTSGSWIKAFWLILLPFGLVNASAFMLPAPHDADGVPFRFARAFRFVALAALRFLALLLTVLLSFATSLTLIDVVGSRWAPKQSFIPGWLDPAIPSIALALSGAFVLVLGGSALVGRVFGRRSGEPDQATAAGESGTAMTPFASSEFYRGDPDTLTLRGLHVAAGLAVPAYMGLSFAGERTAGAGMLITGVFAVTVLLGDPEQAATTGLEEERTQRVGVWHRFASIFAALAVVAGLAMVVWSTWKVFDSERPVALDALGRFLRRNEAFDDRAVLLLYAGAVGLGVLGFAVAGLAWATRRARASTGPASFFRPYSKGMTTIPIASMALLLGVGYSAAAVIGVASVLGAWRGSRKVELGVIPMLDRVAYAWALALIPVLAIVLVLVVKRLMSRGGMAEHALIGYPVGTSIPADRLRAWRSKLGSTVWFSRVKNGVEGMLWTLVVAGVVLSLAIVLELSGYELGLLGLLSQDPHDGTVASMLTRLGALVLIGLMFSLVFLARGAFRDASVQRSVNIVWDVVAFWPHAVHPFIPTPYSLRTVGDLADRIRHHTDRVEGPDGREVVVCGHSQGSLVSFAAMNMLSPDECDRVGLLTYGSQLRLIFARAFPMYVNYDAIHRLHGRLGGAWINLYRDTDPLAGPVLSWNHRNEDSAATSGHFPDPDDGERRDETTDPYRTRRCGDDWRLVDPVPRVDEYQEAPVNALHGHSNYWSNPEWATALAEVRSR